MGKAMYFPWGRRYYRMGIWWKKVPILWGKYGYQFPRLFQFDEFRCIFQWYGKLMGKRKHFPCDEVYYRMVIWLEKCTHTMAKMWVPISQTFAWILLHFRVLWEIDVNTHAFLSHTMKYIKGGESNGKKHPYHGKSMGTNFPGFSHLMIFTEFSCAIGNWLEYPYISHVMKSPIRGAPIL